MRQARVAGGEDDLSTPEIVTNVKTSYELLEVGDGGALSTMLSFKIGDDDMVELKNGEVVVSGHIVTTTFTDDAVVYVINNLRGGGDGSAVSAGDTMKVMVPKAAELGEVTGPWRLTICRADGSYQSIWADVDKDGTAKLGSSRNDAFAEGWTPRIGSGIKQTWTTNEDGMFCFVNEDGSELRARLTM